MYPILFKLGPITIYSYGTLVAIGFMIAIYLARKRSIKFGFNPDKITDLCLYILISGLIGARIFYVLTQIKTFNNRVSLEKMFLPIAGLSLKKELTKQYKEIIDFIQENTDKNDSIFVYPNGPYYQLTKRKSAVSIATSSHYEFSPSLIGITLKQLKMKQPKLVIINIYNASSLKTNLNGMTYNLHSEGNNLIYEGLNTPVEDYICSNYEIIKKLNIAWILRKKETPASVKRMYLPINRAFQWNIGIEGLEGIIPNKPNSFSNPVVFKVKKRNPAIGLRLDTFENINLIKLPVKVNIGFAKVFSKYLIGVYIVTENSHIYLTNIQFATSDWQDVWINLPDLNTKVSKLIIRVSDNEGFFWFGKPKEISIKQPEVFSYNQDLKIDDSALKSVTNKL